ncbi:hypothetical protein FACS1894208_02030 [Clostridia bacterium]|nr:hypothetical protein FACS1894208_02030 [Clostridia bacterium]
MTGGNVRELRADLRNPEELRGILKDERFDVKGDWENPKEGGGASVILRRVREGERLWDIAKSCGASSADILAANSLTDGAEPDAGTLLLIPRSR